MTPLVKTEALVMRCVPFSNTSMIVSWLTPEHGLVATMIKGAQRPKSLFLGQYDLFYTCELIYYDQPNVELYTARECTPLQFRPRFRTDWRAMCLASYLVYLTGRVSPPGVPHPALYQLL
ncbi:MAG: DNA repair protein RecO, partial [Spartobacteria bacterium]|nr:DNA repair protein RecO [Spartobacteria bacterium]